MSMIAIVGLGNPGPEYVDTRHNVGFWIVDEFTKRNECNWKVNRRLHALTTIVKAWTRPTLLIKPLTFVNESGSYLKPLLDYHDCKTEEMIVVHDDVAFETGQLKVSEGKGDGGHNGIKNIICNLGTSFIRFRLGIGPISSCRSMTSHVLGKFSPDEEAVLRENFNFFTKVLQRIVDKGVEHAMNLSNNRK
ncbi:MAG: aminoacyl-tRNA hydrolase [Opitutales bacterium]